MKNILFVFLILLSIAIFSCKTNPGPITQIVASDSSSTTGELTIRVIDGSSSVSNAVVDLFFAYSDVNTGVPLLRGYSTSSGYVNFGYLNYGNYYVKAQKDAKVKIVPVQVQARKQLTYKVDLN